MALTPRAARLAGNSTAAIVECTDARFVDAAGILNADTITTDIRMRFNGSVEELADRVTFARNATNAEKQAAVRNRLNAILTTYELGNTLNNANIQIVGLPV